VCTLKIHRKTARVSRLGLWKNGVFLDPSLDMMQPMSFEEANDAPEDNGILVM